MAFATERRLRVAAWAGWLTAAAACVLVGVTLFGPRLWSPGNTTPEFRDTVASNEDTLGTAPQGDNTTDPMGPDRLAATDVYDDGPGRWPDPVALLDLDESLARTASQSVVGRRRRPLATMVYDDDGRGPQTVTRPLNMPAASRLRYDTFINAEQERLPEGYSFDDERALKFFEQMYARRSQVASADIPTVRTTDERTSATEDVSEQQAMPVVRQPEPAILPDLALGDDLYHASVLLNVLASTDTHSFSDVQLIREAIESDRLLDRLAQAGSQLSPDEEAVVQQAWTTLEFVNGKLDQASLMRIQGIIRESGVANRMEELSGRVTY